MMNIKQSTRGFKQKMEIVKAKIPLRLFESLTTDQRLQIEVDQIEPDDYDYSDDAIWQELKSKSTKAFKELKAREFKIRNNL